MSAGLLSQLPKTESLTVEFTSVWNNDTICKSLVAFANTVGGDLYIGLDDNGSPVGVTDLDEILQALTSVTRKSVFPSLASIVNTEILTVGENLQIVRIHVNPGRFRPYSLDPKRSETVYIRVENTNCPASLDDLGDLIRANNVVPFERRIADLQNLTFSDLQQLCREQHFPLDPKSHLQYGLWDPTLQSFTNLGFICSDQSSFAAVLVEFTDNDKLLVKRSRRTEGSVFSLIDAIQTFVHDTNTAGWTFPTDGTLTHTEHFFVPPLVLREAVVNAVAHRDYLNTTPITVQITPDAVEIFTVGGLPGLEPDQILSGMATNCRNPLLAALLGKLHLMEGIGNGFRQLRHAYPDDDLSDLLTMAPRHFIIRLPRRNPMDTARDTVDEELLHFFRQRRNASRAEIQTFLGVSTSTAAKRLQTWMQRDIIEKYGHGPATRYRLKQ